MRKALVFKDYAKTDFSYEGIFHGFGIEFEELRDGVGQYTVAIIELENGEVVSSIYSLDRPVETLIWC